MKIGFLAAIAFAAAGMPAPAMASNCTAQYFNDIAACEGDSICEDNAAAAYTLCLAGESDELPDCERPNSCDPE